MTVRRTIALTFDLDLLGCMLSSDFWRPTSREQLVPLGWFVPWANAGAVLVDADGRVIPYLTCADSDGRVRGLIGDRLDELGRVGGLKDRPDDVKELKDKLALVLEHRADPGRPGNDCASCRAVAPDRDGYRGYRELMSDKWGCRAVGELLDRLYLRCSGDPEAKELVKILLAWQTNFVLFARLDASSVPGMRVTLQLAYDEELMSWDPPWERRKRVLGKPGRDLACGEARQRRRLVSRGGPFHPELDELAPRGLAGLLARCGSMPLRAAGRRGFLRVEWHVVWQQASGLDAPDHHVDVVLPNELVAVRMRMLRISDGRRYATVADQVGSHATIVAPDASEDGLAADDGRWTPTLFSLVLSQGSPSSWCGGAWIALITAVGLLTVAWRWLPEVVEHTEAGVGTLLLAPTLVATALSVRAGSQIAEQLTTMLRRLIAAVAVLAATCAVGLAVQPASPQAAVGRRPPPPDPQVLGYVWKGAGWLLLVVAALLFAGAHRIRRMLEYGRRSAPRRIAEPSPDNVLNPKGRDASREGREQGPKPPRIRPPDCWLKADEGDLVPWGWLHPYERGSYADRNLTWVDRMFWKKTLQLQTEPAFLVRWVRRCVGYRCPPL